MYKNSKRLIEESLVLVPNNVCHVFTSVVVDRVSLKRPLRWHRSRVSIANATNETKLCAVLSLAIFAYGADSLFVPRPSARPKSTKELKLLL